MLKKGKSKRVKQRVCSVRGSLQLFILITPLSSQASTCQALCPTSQAVLWQTKSHKPKLSFPTGLHQQLFCLGLKEMCDPNQAPPSAPVAGPRLSRGLSSHLGATQIVQGAQHGMEHHGACCGHRGATEPAQGEAGFGLWPRAVGMSSPQERTSKILADT